MAASPSSLGAADEGLPGGDDAVRFGGIADEVHRYLLARQPGNKIYVHHGKAPRFVDAAHDGGDIADISI